MEMIKIRSSMLTGYPDCARRAATGAFSKLIKKAGYKLNQRGAGIGATVGTSSHAGVELSLRTKMETGEAAKVSDCIDASVAEFEDLKGAEEIIFDDTTKNESEAKNQIVQIQRAHHACIQPEIIPSLIEERMFANIGDGFVLSGQPDALTHDRWCRDLKTGAKESNYMAQLGGYSILSRSNGHPVERTVLDYVPRAKKDKPVIPFSIEYDRKTCEISAARVINQIKRDYQDLQSPEIRGVSQQTPALCSALTNFAQLTGLNFVNTPTTNHLKGVT